jgi:predicted MFS family arabinose efflux permease
LLNAASFGGVIVSLLFMKLPVYHRKERAQKVVAEFSEGFTYIKKTPDIALMVVMLAAVSLLVLPYNTVLPVFAKIVFKGDASTFGYINSFVGIGAVLGTVFLASRKPGTHLKRILFASTLLMGVGLVCFSQLKNFPAAMFFAAIAGYGSVAQFTISNIVVQSDAAPEMRGRTMGILLMAIFGMMPIGSVITGAVSERIGAPATVLAQGVIAIVIAVIFVKFLTRPIKLNSKQ